MTVRWIKDRGKIEVDGWYVVGAFVDGIFVLWSTERGWAFKMRKQPHAVAMPIEFPESLEECE